MTEPPDRPLLHDETARRRLGARQLLSLAIGLAAVVYFILLIVQNRREVRVDYVFGSGHHKLIWLIVVSGFLGWLFGLATSFLLRRRLRRDR